MKAKTDLGLRCLNMLFYLELLTSEFDFAFVAYADQRFGQCHIDKRISFMYTQAYITIRLQNKHRGKPQSVNTENWVKRNVCAFYDILNPLNCVGHSVIVLLYIMSKGRCSFKPSLIIFSNNNNN